MSELYDFPSLDLYRRIGRDGSRKGRPADTEFYLEFIGWEEGAGGKAEGDSGVAEWTVSRAGGGVCGGERAKRMGSSCGTWRANYIFLLAVWRKRSQVDSILPRHVQQMESTTMVG